MAHPPASVLPPRSRSLVRALKGITRRPLTEDAGFALLTAIIILFITVLLTGASITVATQTSTSTTRDTNVKAEVEAAEAGLHIAGYRLSQLTPSDTQCVNEKEAVAAKTTEEAESKCKDSSESLGNGASFQYWTSLPLAVGAKCAGRAAASLPRVIQRCETSKGLVNGVEPAVRLQARVLATRLFPINGLVGLESVELANNVQVKAVGATNGKFTIGNKASTEGVLLGPSAPAGEPTVGPGGSSGPVTRESTEFTLAPVNTGTSATANSNSRIEKGLDPSSGVTYNKATRSLEIANGGKLKLEGEVYNFCNFTTGTGVEITLKAAATTTIYIDSPNNPGSGCKAGDGKLLISNNAIITNPSKEANKLQIFVYDASGGPIEITNNAVFYGIVYAPHSTVNIHNNAEVFGAVAGNAVNLKNNGTFNSQQGVEGLLAEAFHRSAWEQCTPGSGASEGC